MKASVNLRGDLAKLSDAELAERLQAAWQAVDTARKRKGWGWRLFRVHNLAYPWRGPLRHPRVYRFMSIFSSSDGSLLAALIAAVFSGKQIERFLRKDAGADEYLSIAEVRDIMDEIERRRAVRGSRRLARARRSGA